MMVTVTTLLIVVLHLLPAEATNHRSHALALGVATTTPTMRTPLPVAAAAAGKLAALGRSKKRNNRIRPTSLATISRITIAIAATPKPQW
mgnify:CR=1 FL=1